MPEIKPIKEMTYEEAYCILLEMVMPADKENKALEKALEALKKQIQKKPLYQYYEEDVWHVTTAYGICPICGKSVEKYRAHCQCCGQALDWSDKK